MPVCKTIGYHVHAGSEKHVESVSQEGKSLT